MQGEVFYWMIAPRVCTLVLFIISKGSCIKYKSNHPTGESRGTKEPPFLRNATSSQNLKRGVASKHGVGGVPTSLYWLYTNHCPQAFLLIS